ncbi:MAG TPA: methanogenesis marker 17 protein [Methanobacterium sp.]|nr:methanogenesis marker 17 protein [Methanobacterium sp.]
MKVECYDETGAEVYDMVVRQILQDLQITRAVKDLRVYVDPREPVFIIVISYEKTAPPVRLLDFAEYEKDRAANEVFLKIKDETYLPELLSLLWEREGRNKVHQSSRSEVIVDDPQTDIRNLVVHNPEEDLRKKIYDALFRIIPEGLRVVDHFSEGNLIALTASDETIKEEWLQKTREVIEDMKKNASKYKVK